MTSLGQHGATEQSWERNAARVAFMKVYRDNPTAGKNELAELLRGEGFADVDVDKAVYLYAVKNFLDSIAGYERREEERQERRAASPPPTPEQRAARKAATEAAAEKIVDTAKTIFLFNLPMPNGKLARNCTGEYLVTMGQNWVKVGRKIGKNQTLAQAMTEEEAQKIYDGN